MKLFGVITIALFGSALGLAQETSTSPLVLSSTMALPGVTGNFDHLALDLVGRRLFVTPESDHSVIVLDLTSGKVAHVITGIGTPHAVLYREDLNRIFVTDGDPGELKIYDGSTYELVKKITLLAHTDSVKYDPKSKYLYIITGGKDAHQTTSTISIADTTTGSIVGNIRIDSEALEAMAIDGKTGRLYVSDKAKNRIDIVDIGSRTLVGTWPITLGQVNVSIALDPIHHRLFVGCRSGDMVVFDTETGRELASLLMTKGVDDMIYDPATQRVYASCGFGQGVVEIYKETAPDKIVALTQIPSGPFGKTSLLSTDLQRYFVSVPGHGDTPASVLVYEVH